VNCATTKNDTPVIVKFILSQTIGGIVIWGGLYFFIVLGSNASLLGLEWVYVVLFIGQGIIASVIGYHLKLPNWWLIINFIFPNAIVIALQWSLPAWVYLVTLIGLWLVFSNTIFDRVPLYLSNLKTWQALDIQISKKTYKPGKPTHHFIDFGCGLGGTLFYLSAKNPNVSFTGIESAILPYFISRLRSVLHNATHKNNFPVKIIYGNFRDINLSTFDMVYCFLSPHPMAEVFDKAISEMSPKSMFISNSFLVPDKIPDDTIHVDDARQTKLFIWKI